MLEAEERGRAGGFNSKRSFNGHRPLERDYTGISTSLLRREEEIYLKKGLQETFSIFRGVGTWTKRTTYFMRKTAKK